MWLSHEVNKPPGWGQIMKGLLCLAKEFGHDITGSWETLKLVVLFGYIQTYTKVDYVMNPCEPITQLQQLITHGQSYVTNIPYSPLSYFETNLRHYIISAINSFH